MPGNEKLLKKGFFLINHFIKGTQSSLKTIPGKNGGSFNRVPLKKSDEF